MDFTREPIIETVITPKEGYKIVVRSSKNPGSEEYFVDAVEVVTFGNCSFFRSLERPKAFLVPVSDYEILEVREARIVLKNVGLERSIKISGGKEREASKPKEAREEKLPQEPQTQNAAPEQRQQPESRDSRRRDRRRQGRRRRDDEGSQKESNAIEEQKVELTPPTQEGNSLSPESQPIAQSILSSLLTPPPTLISETLKSYKENALFKEAFYTKEELEQGKPEVEETDEPVVAKSSDSVSDFEEFQRSVERDEEIYHERMKGIQSEPSDTEKL